jgi:hypothetical protein
MKGIAGSSDFTLPIRKPSGTVQPTVQIDKAKPALEKTFVQLGQQKPGINF